MSRSDALWDGLVAVDDGQAKAIGLNLVAGPSRRPIRSSWSSRGGPPTTRIRWRRFGPGSTPWWKRSTSSSDSM